MYVCLLSQGGDAKFFQTTKKGEIHELKSDLNSLNRDKIKDAGQSQTEEKGQSVHPDERPHIFLNAFCSSVFPFLFSHIQ
jgi:hypothetical protein